MAKNGLTLRINIVHLSYRDFLDKYDAEADEGVDAPQ